MSEKTEMSNYDRIKKIKDDLKKIQEDTEDDSLTGDIAKIKLMTSQLENLTKEHSKILSQIRNQNFSVVEKLLDHMAENEKKKQ